MRQSPKVLCLVLAGAAAALLATSAARAADTLPIGAVGSLSGGGTAWGLATQRGAELAIDEVNKAGGVAADGKTYAVKLIMYDDQYTGQGGTTAATRLVNEDKVKFIIGPIGSAPALGVIAVTNPAKVVVLSDGYAPKILDNDAHAAYNFRVSNTPNEFMPAAVKWLAEHYPDNKTVGIIGPNDATGQGTLPVMIKNYEAAGYKVAFKDYFERGTTEFTPLLTRMMAAGVNLFELDGNSPGDCGLMVKQARQIGYKGRIIQIGGPSIAEVMSVSGPLASGFLSYDMFDFKVPRAEAWVKAYHDKYGAGIINGQTPAFYNATRIMLEAIKRAATTDTDKVRDTIEKMEGYDAGLVGPIVWGGKKTYGVDHQLLLPFLITEVRDGEEVTLAHINPIKD